MKAEKNQNNIRIGIVLYGKKYGFIPLEEMSFMSMRVRKRRLFYVYIPLFFLLGIVLSSVVLAALTGPRTFNIAVVLSNTAPKIFFNYTNTTLQEPLFSITPVENNTRANLVIRFNVTDADGAANIVDTSASANISLNTSYSRNNNSANCRLVYTDTATNGKGYECTIPVAYYDNASSEWKINVSVADLAGAVAYNDSMNITVNSLSALRVVETELAVSTTTSSDNNEITIAINNTGNFNFGLINLTPYDLNASLTDYFMITGNFSVNGTPSSIGVGRNITNATPMNVTKNGITDYLKVPVKSMRETGGNSTIYIYIDVPAQVTTGVTYNSSKPWELFGQ